jgi:hypothetical protein
MSASISLNRLLVLIGAMVMMVVVMVGVYNHHNLRLRRIRHCETEEKNRSIQKLFHALG